MSTPAPQRLYSDLVASDLAHFIHPQYHAADHQEPVIFVRGQGALLYDIQGKEYIDGLSSLWNVAVGHGRRAERNARVIGLKT